MSRRDLPPELRLGAAFVALRVDSAEPPRATASARARAAMHAAAEARQAANPLRPVLDRGRHALALHRVLGGLSGAALALSTVTALGWNAPAGTPLEVVRLAHEQISLVLPGTDRAAADLGFAEARLDQAAAGEDVAAALDEAQRLLDDAHGALPADTTLPVWSRWQDDGARLAALRAATMQPAVPHSEPAPSAPAASSAHHTTESQPASTAHGSQGHGKGATSEDPGKHAATPVPTAAPASGDDAHGVHTTPATSQRSAAADVAAAHGNGRAGR